MIAGLWPPPTSNYPPLALVHSLQVLTLRLFLRRSAMHTGQPVRYTERISKMYQVVAQTQPVYSLEKPLVWKSKLYVFPHWVTHGFGRGVRSGRSDGAGWMRNTFHGVKTLTYVLPLNSSRGFSIITSEFLSRCSSLSLLVSH